MQIRAPSSFFHSQEGFFIIESTILSENGFDSVRAGDYANGSLNMSCKASWKRRRTQDDVKIRALSSFFHPQEGARSEGRDTKRWWILMDSHRLATQTRLLRLAHAVKCRRQRSPCRRQQLRLEALPPCALLHRVQALGSENLNRLNLVLVSAGW